MKKYVIYWFTNEPGIEFARDTDGKAQLYTKEQANDLTRVSPRYYSMEIGIAKAGWVPA